MPGCRVGRLRGSKPCLCRGSGSRPVTWCNWASDGAG
jgi:hypothetical protein